MHMSEFSLSMMPQREKRKSYTNFLRKRLFQIRTDHTQNIGIVGETVGGTLKKIISYLELGPSGKSMVSVDLAQNVPITKVMRKIP